MHPNYTLVANASLNKQELQEVSELAATIEAEDQFQPLWYPYLLPQIRTEGSNLLCYKNKVLIGFLSVYFFYEKACEITLMVLPSQRNKGIATNLLKALIPLLEKKEIEKVIFAPKEINKEKLEKKGFHYDLSEYKMLRQGFEPILTAKKQLSIQLATPNDLESLCKIDNLCFQQNRDMSERFKALISDPSYSILIAHEGLKAIGKAHIQWFEDHVAFFNIAVKPKYQKQGFGSELLSFCINYVLKQGQDKIYLDVETRNQQALLLYTRQGFKTIQKYEYWSIPLKKLKNLIHS